MRAAAKGPRLSVAIGGLPTVKLLRRSIVPEMDCSIWDCKTEQRVLLVLPDIPEFAAAYFGTMKIGAVAVPTSTALRASDYAYFLEESRARIAIVHSTLLAEFGPALLGPALLQQT